VSKLSARFGKPVAQVAGAAFALGGVGVLAGWL
jgi:urease accessory protein